MVEISATKKRCLKSKLMACTDNGAALEEELTSFT